MYLDCSRNNTVTIVVVKSLWRLHKEREQEVGEEDWTQQEGSKKPNELHSSERFIFSNLGKSSWDLLVFNRIENSDKLHGDAINI